ncbi:MAG: phospholipase D family protein [Bacteroidales bacterium]|nr:phospholipase D family protein [Bacteroidales bacterium]
MNYELAFYLKDKSKIDIIEARLRRHLSSNLIKGRTIVAEIGDLIPKKIQTFFLYNLINEQVIVKEEISQSVEEYIFSFNIKNFDYYFSSQKHAVEILDGLDKQFEEKKSLEDIEIVATLPSLFFGEQIPEVYSIYPSMKRLIINTKKQLWIINPFFDSFGIEYLIPTLCSAAERGVDIKIITRNLLEEETDEKMLETVVKLVSKFNEKNLLDMLEMRFFFKRNESTGKQEYALHSKVILSDRTSCYLGSANVTETSLKYNFELGVIIRGTKVTKVLEILERLYEVSDLIDINKLHNKNSVHTYNTKNGREV